MTRIARYLMGTVIGGALVTLLVLVSLEMVFSFIDDVDHIGRNGLTAGTIMLSVLLNAPAFAYEVFPMATLIGSLMGLGGLAARNELTAMRAAGMSILGVARAVMAAGLLLGGMAFAVGEWVAPPAQRWAQELQAERSSGSIAALGDGGFWARDGQHFVQVQRALSNERLQDVRIFELGPEARIERIVTAAQARFEGDTWQLQDVAITRIDEQGVRVERLDGLAWRSELRPQVLDVVVVEPEALPAAGLYDYIRYLERNGLESDRYRLALWIKVATPLATITMLLLTVPMVFGAARSVNTGQRIFLGVLIGLVFFLANRLLNHSALVYGLPPSLSALLPTALFFVAGVIGISRIR